jgi:hypothetical protein
MEKETILRVCKELEGQTSLRNFYAIAAELKNLIQVYAGKNNPFYQAVDKVNINAILASEYLDNIIKSFLRTIENDLISGASYERRIKIEVVNDYLSQAEELLNLDEFHPATATVLIGASLEEFLRNWVIDLNIDIGEQNPSIDSYAKTLRKKEIITKQDLKEIIVWGGYRNDAAHGNWKAVEDRDKISMMLKGVSLFIKQYSK